ncbi:MAG: hypothetical protein ABI679_15690, partial [Gemmatimonadota bacterium]
SGEKMLGHLPYGSRLSSERAQHMKVNPGTLRVQLLQALVSQRFSGVKALTSQGAATGTHQLASPPHGP